MAGTDKAREKAYRKWEKLEEERGEELYDFVEANPLKSVKELSDKLKIPRSSLQGLLKKFIADGLLIEESHVANNTIKKLYRVRKFEEHEFGISTVDERPIYLNTPVIEQLFVTQGVQKVSQDAIVTLNTLFSDLCLKVIIGTSQKYHLEKTNDELSEQNINQYFQELISVNN